MIKIITLPTGNLVFEHRCSCGAVFTYYHVDTKGDYIICPVCAHAESVIGDKIINKNEAPEEAPESHFRYPNDFYHFGESPDGKKMSDADIQEMVDRIYDTLNEGKLGDFSSIATGDTLVSGHRNDEQIVVWVAKNYWEDEIEV